MLFAIEWPTWNYCKNSWVFFSFTFHPARNPRYLKIAITKIWYTLEQKILHKPVFSKNFKDTFSFPYLFQILLSLGLCDFSPELKHSIPVRKIQNMGSLINKKKLHSIKNKLNLKSAK